MTTYTTKIAKNGSVRYYDAQTGKAIAKKTALENERNFIRTNGTTKERYELAKETYRVDSNGKIEKFGWHQELRRDSSGFYHVEVRGWYNHCGTTDYDFANDMQEEFGLTIDEFKAEANAEAQAEEKTEETAAEEIVEVEANTEVKAEETESGIGDIFKAAVKTLGEEVSESDAKFEIGKTYFVMHFLTHQTDTITVEARTAQMLTGTTSEGTRKFRIFENVRGEFVTIGKDDDGYDIYIYAKNEFTTANVEAGKKAAIEDAAQLGINPEPQAETESPAEDKKACKHYSINPDFDDEDRPIKYNHVNIVIEDGRLKIDGLFECWKPETAYNRFRKIMAQAAADVPELKGWDAWEPAKKLTFDDTEKVWLNENGDMIFDTKYAVETLNVDINEDNIYIWGTFYTTAEAYKAAHPEEPASELDAKAEEFKAEVRYVTGCVGAWFANLIDAKAFVEKHEMEHHEDFQYSLIEKSVGYDFETVYVNIAENFKPQGFEPRAIRNELRNKVNEKLPEGFIEVNTGADAFKKVAPYFTDGASFKAASKGFNHEDVFTFEGKGGIFLRVACTPDNSRVECVEVLNANESGSKRTPLLVAIKPISPEPEKFTATQITFPNGYEGEPTVEVSRAFDNLDDAARFIADDNPIIGDTLATLKPAYDGYYFGSVYFAGWRITRGGKTLCEVDFLGNTHGDEEIDNLVCKYFDENDQFIIPDVPGFRAPEAQDDYKEFRTKVDIVKATFTHAEALDVKKILAPLAVQAQVELGNITLADNDDKTCTVNIEVKGSTNEIEKFKALLDGRQPEPPTNSKKFIKAALDTEPERYQQVATARKEVVASPVEATAMTKLDTLKEKRAILRRAFFSALKDHYVKHNDEFFDAAESGYTTFGVGDHTLFYRKDGGKFIKVDDKAFDALNRLEIKLDIAEDAVNAEIAKTQFKFEAGKYYVNDDGNKFFCIKRNKKSVKFFDCAFTQDDGFMDLDADEDDDWERKVFKCKIQFDERGEFVDWYEGDPDDDGDRDLITILAKNVTDPPETEHDPEHEDEDDKPDDFTAELAKLTAEQSDAKKILDIKQAELIKVQNEHQAAQDKWLKANRAVENLYRAKAEELSDRLLPLKRGCLEMKTQDGFSPFIYTDTVTISLDKGKFAIHGDCSEKIFFELARYDTPAQVEAAINGLKATDALGGDKFIFPTADELNSEEAIA